MTNGSRSSRITARKVGNRQNAENAKKRGHFLFAERLRSATRVARREVSQFRIKNGQGPALCPLDPTLRTLVGVAGRSVPCQQQTSLCRRGDAGTRRPSRLQITRETFPCGFASRPPHQFIETHGGPSLWRRSKKRTFDRANQYLDWSLC